ncbi:hypothetical protein WISP_144484 [Willisornis vidua]|uniref:Uncharacterized protein n=1 Tax=Willisornis vidua TaxID=1566151 RepID=A0ABQ9CL85_9PASS|nr:hypothetical protein WISP_144484 [Willisornis vidua]
MSVKEHTSTKEKLQFVVNALKEMQVTMGTKDKNVQESICHTLCTKIPGPITSLQDNTAAVKELSEIYKGAVENITDELVALMLKYNNFPETIESAIQLLLSSPVLSLQVSELLIDYADIVKMLQQNSTPNTTEGSSA